MDFEHFIIYHLKQRILLPFNDKHKKAMFDELMLAEYHLIHALNL